MHQYCWRLVVKMMILKVAIIVVWELRKVVVAQPVVIVVLEHRKVVVGIVVKVAVKKAVLVAVIIQPNRPVHLSTFRILPIIPNDNVRSSATGNRHNFTMLRRFYDFLIFLG